MTTAYEPHTEQGIVLHTVKYGESAMIVYILTRSAGRGNYIVQSLGKGKGNKSALFQAMFPIEFVSVAPIKGTMPRLKDVEMRRVLRKMPFDIRKNTMALFMAETLYRLIKEVEANIPLYDFVEDAVFQLDELESGVANFHLWFLVRLSSFLGFYPANEWQAGCWFDITEGSFVPIMPHHKIALTPFQASTLNRLMCVDSVADLSEIELLGSERSEFLDAMLTYFGYHLETIHSVASIKILRELF